MMPFCHHITAFAFLALGMAAAGAVFAGPPDGAEPPAAEGRRILPPAVDLKPVFESFHLSVRRQGPRGTCSVFAVTHALEYALAVKSGKGVPMSVEFLNWVSHKEAGRTVDGGFFHELWNGYLSHGICAEADLPYQQSFDPAIAIPTAAADAAKQNFTPRLKLQWIKEWDPHTGLTNTQLAAIKASIARRWPVLGGFRWPKIPVWKEGVLQMCPAEEVFDGHSILISGYRDDPALPGGGVFLIRNSGGDGPDGQMPYAYVEAYMNDAAFISVTAMSPPSVTPAKP
jgi:Papain family cysteine protease